MKRSFFLTLLLYALILFTFLKIDQFFQIAHSQKQISLTSIKLIKSNKCQCSACRCKSVLSPKKKPQKKPEKKREKKVKKVSKKKLHRSIKKERPKSIKKPKIKKRIQKPKKQKIVKKIIKTSKRPKHTQQTAMKPTKSIQPRQSKKKKNLQTQNFKQTVAKPKTITNQSHQPKAKPLQAFNTTTKRIIQTPSYNQIYLQAFADKIREAILRRKYYPRIARRTRKEGTVVIECKLLPDGTLQDIRFIHSAPHKILDKAALKTVQDASSEFPKPKEPVILRIPLEYRLK